MHPVIHVSISILIGLGVNLHHKHRYSIVMIAAFMINGLIDMDYLFFTRGIFTERYFSTGIVMLYIPVFFLLGVHIYEKGHGRSLYTRIALLVILISLSHLLMDTFSPDEAVYLYYPFSMTEYRLDQALLPYVVIAFACVVAIVNRLESYLYSNNEGTRKKYPVHKIPFMRDYTERLNRLKDTVDKALSGRD